MKIQRLDYRASRNSELVFTGPLKRSAGWIDGQTEGMRTLRIGRKADDNIKTDSQGTG